VGAGYFDTVAQIITAGQSSLAALKGSTEQMQFTEKTPAFSEAEITTLPRRFGAAFREGQLGGEPRTP